MDKKRHGWFRFSLRTLFLLVVLIALLAGWGSWPLKWIRDRRDFDGGEQGAAETETAEDVFREPHGPIEAGKVPPPGADAAAAQQLSLPSLPRNSTHSDRSTTPNPHRLTGCRR
jgi:hypothetical protein